jgi:hypothetical protein
MALSIGLINGRLFSDILSYQQDRSSAHRSVPVPGAEALKGLGQHVGCRSFRSCCELRAPLQGIGPLPFSNSTNSAEIIDDRGHVISDR